MTNAPSCPLVMVEWEDSAQPLAAWAFLADREPRKAIRCVSVGWLITDTPTLKEVAPNMGSVNITECLQVSGVKPLG